jgi:hypothetical protein
MRQAYEQANEVVNMASNQAQDILNNATMEANALRTAAMQYMDDMLTHLENIIGATVNTAVTNYESLIGGLNQYRDIIQSNRNELHPSEAEFDAMADQDSMADVSAEA